MQVDSLRLVSFRTYESLDVSFPSGPQVVVGPNATGKTNLLEALVVLGTARSHRASLEGELISWGADFARIESTLGSSAVEILMTRTLSGGARKRVLVNGVARRPQMLATVAPVVL